MSQNLSAKIRSVALVGHGAAGKTTLAESLLAVLLQAQGGRLAPPLWDAGEWSRTLWLPQLHGLR